MAKKTTKNSKSKEVTKKHFKTPTETWWGKTIVWIIFFGMVGVLLLTLVLAIFQGTA